MNPHDDLALLAAREREVALQAAPPVIDGVRPTALLTVDPLGALWEGWDVATGRPALLRVLLPRWRDDAPMRRRFEEGARRRGQAVIEQAGTLLVRELAPGIALGDMDADELVPDPVEVARAAGETLLVLDRLQATGLPQTGPFDRLVRRRGDGSWTLHSFDAFAQGGSGALEVGSLASALARLDPDGRTPAGRALLEWAAAPPPTAQDAGELLVRALATDLLEARHHLALLSRNTARREQLARLARASRALEHAVPPPALRICVRADEDPMLVMLECDGEQVFGGTASDTHSRFLPLLWSARAGLDAPATRAVLRAWAMRRRGNEERRRALNEALGADDRAGDALVRWLSGMARLRAARLVLDASGRMGLVR